MIVHGIPNGRRLQEGDIFSADLGLILDGWHADRAYTYPVGEIDPEAARLLEVTEKSLEAAIQQCRPGARLSDVSHAVQTVAEAAGFSVVREYAGHQIGREMHEPPHVPNLAPEGPGRGMALDVGIVLAIEPMLTLGSPDVTELDDGWTVVTLDGSPAAHWEHTVAVTAQGPWVLTALDGGPWVSGAGAAQP